MGPTLSYLYFLNRSESDLFLKELFEWSKWVGYVDYWAGYIDNWAGLTFLSFSLFFYLFILTDGQDRLRVYDVEQLIQMKEGNKYI